MQCDDCVVSKVENISSIYCNFCPGSVYGVSAQLSVEVDSLVSNSYSFFYKGIKKII